jgi:hypothetical protein
MFRNCLVFTMNGHMIRHAPSHVPDVFHRLLQNHLLLSTHRTTEAGSCRPQ